MPRVEWPGNYVLLTRNAFGCSQHRGELKSWWELPWETNKFQQIKKNVNPMEETLRDENFTKHKVPPAWPDWPCYSKFKILESDFDFFFKNQRNFIIVKSHTFLCKEPLFRVKAGINVCQYELRFLQWTITAPSFHFVTCDGVVCFTLRVCFVTWLSERKKLHCLFSLGSFLTVI